jgi:hypothetical protein
MLLPGVALEQQFWGVAGDQSALLARRFETA